MNPQTSTERKLTRARTQLLLNQPFFGTVCLRLKLMPGAVPTMATDGCRIVYDSAFVEDLKPAELEAVLAHEVMHCALGHHCRRGERDPALWNQAADLAINPILVSNGFTLPAGALLDPAFDNLSAEEIYARLLQRNQEESSTPPPEPASKPPNAGPGTGQGSQGQLARESGHSAQTPSAPMQSGIGDEAGNQLPHPGAFGEVGTQPMSRASLRRQPRKAVNNTSGASPQIRQNGRRRLADTSRPIWPDH
jgi:hypothetical protein